jgi:NAD+ synthase
MEKRQLVDKPQKLSLDAEMATGVQVNFIRDELSGAGFDHLVVGVSGGLDSAVVTFLSARAIGRQNVFGVILPYRDSNPGNIEDAEDVISRTGVKKYVIDITPQVDPYFEKFPQAGKNRRGNKMARERMSILYDLSAAEKALVIGTSNKSEILLGYGTIFGDLACAINPLGDLYKTQVRILAKHLGVPEKIIAKPPSADLYVGQSDEGEFGFTYEDVDRLLYLLVDERYAPDQCEKEGFDKKLVKKVIEMIKKNQFKRSAPVIARLSGRTVGVDFRCPGDRGK